MKRLVLLDAHAIIHRAYHALPPLTSSGGEPTGAVYGFSSILLRIVKDLKPDYLVAAFDLPGPTKRHEAYKEYKAHRPSAPPDLVTQFARVREALGAFHIPIHEHAGYEADDIIGTIARKFEKKKNIEVIIVTGDRDAFQLIRPNVFVYVMKRGITDMAMYDEAKIQEQYGLRPRELIEVKALQGDASDNIPGVSGIGEKTALSLIRRFGSLAKLYRVLAEEGTDMGESVIQKLKAGEEDAKLSRELGRIRTDVPVRFQEKQAQWSARDAFGEDARAFLTRLGFSSLLKRVSGLHAGAEADFGEKLIRKDRKPSKKAGAQESLLSVSPSSALAVVGRVSELASYLENHKGARFGLMRGPDNELFIISENGDAVAAPSKLLSARPIQEFFKMRGDFFVYDGKSLIHFLRERGIELGGVAFDIMLAGSLLQSGSRDISYLGIAARELGKMVAQDMREELSSFFSLARVLQDKIKQEKEENVFYDIEMPLVRILADMEERGVLIDSFFLEKFSASLEKDLAALANVIHKNAGEEFNINSSQQLSRILFEKLGISPRGLKKTQKGGVTSTRESELEKLRGMHPVIELLLRYRELAKLKTTYVDVLPRLADARTGHLSTTFHQLGTSTGRISSSDPNLQNIPIMSEYGRAIRKAFVAEGGYAFVSCDYSQIELRVAAHIAEDEKMTQAFREGKDIHKITAAEIYNIPPDQVDADARRAAKTLNFGILYGMGPRGLSEAAGISREDARKFIDEYFRDFSGIKNYIARTKQFAYENGYVETIFGRRRYIPEVLSSNWQMRREAERMAVNMPIQGSATGDIIKIAMIKVNQWIQGQGREDDVRMILQVHDELVFEIRDSLLRESAAKIKDIMERAVALRVPLAVDVKAGPNWGEQKLIADRQ